MRFNIYNGGELIGWSELEQGDPPMGMVFGTFHRNEGYAEVQPLFQAHYEHNPYVPRSIWEKIEALDLRAETEEGETVSNLVYFIDPTSEFADEKPQVHVRCRTGEIYRRYFSEHIRAYEASFDDDGAA